MKTLGSLFDGIGGFPLAAVKLGIRPAWASEIAAACISVTKKHFPGMKHLGDIKAINGAEIDPVDIITFGSPCQDLSVAGKRAGLKGGQSGLFMEAARVIKEMRGKTNGKKPGYAVWENVTGAFSSNKGEDFGTVLSSLASIGEGRAVSIPRPAKGWLKAGVIVGNRWSLAWRTLDAQYWGVPQRRRRVFLVADFGTQRAGEILFKPEGLSGNIAEGGEAGEGTAGSAEGGVKKAVGFDGRHQNITGDRVNTLRGGRVDKDNIGLVILNDQGGDNISVEKTGVAACLRSETHGHLPVVYDARGNGCGKVASTITGDHESRVTDYTALAVTGIDSEMNALKDKAGTLRAHGSGGAEQFVAFGFKSFGEYAQSDKSKALLESDDVTTCDLALSVAPTLDVSYAKKYGCNQFVKQWGEFLVAYAVRRMTPLECERLMGFPDGWTECGHEGEKISDSARYRALGNSVAVPCVLRVLRGIAGGKRNG